MIEHWPPSPRGRGLREIVIGNAEISLLDFHLPNSSGESCPEIPLASSRLLPHARWLLRLVIKLRSELALFAFFRQRNAKSARSKLP